MQSQSKQGRPKASSRETLSEAACELFLEKGYEATSVIDITARAGVSRSSFFNYFAAKSDVIWSGFDSRIDQLAMTLTADSNADAFVGIRVAISELADGFAPDALALALSNAPAMGAEGELQREGAARIARISATISQRLMQAAFDELAGSVVAAAYAGGMLAAINRWALDGSGRAPLSERMAEAVALVEQLADPFRHGTSL